MEFRRLFDTLKANAHTMLRYEPGEYTGRVTLFAAEQSLDQTILGPLGQTEGAAPPDPLHAWERLAAGGVDVHVVPGNHFTMMREPFVEALAEPLRGCIDETLRASAGEGEDFSLAFAQVHSGRLG